jgi:aerobic C4-dicarboxylate transport protein
MIKWNHRLDWTRNPWLFIGFPILGALLAWFIPSAAMWFTPLLKVYVHLLNLFVLPLIVIAIVFGLANFSRLPDSSWRFLMAVGLGFAGLFACGLVALGVGSVLSPGAGLSGGQRWNLGQLSMDHGALYSLALFEESPQNPDTMTFKLMPDNLFNALANESLGLSMLGALIFGLGFAWLPVKVSKPLFDRLELIYLALEILITTINRMLPLVAFAYAVNWMASFGQGGYGLVSEFMKPFVIAALVSSSALLGLISFSAGFPFLKTLSALKESLLITFLARNSAAGVPSVIHCMCDVFGFRRALVKFLAPLFPFFFHAGEVIFLTLLALFVANLYQSPLDGWAHFQILILSMACAFVSRALVGSGTLIMAGYMNQFFQLPFEAVLPAFVVIDVVVAGFKSVLSVLLSCAVIAVVSKGLSREMWNEEPDVESLPKHSPVFLSIGRNTLILLLAMVLAFLITVFAIGFGLGLQMPDGLAFF